MKSTFYILLLLFCCSCASLTKSQLTEVNQFGQLTKSFTAYPAEVVTSLNQVRTEDQLFDAGAISDAKKHLESVQKIDSFKKTAAGLDEQTRLAFQIINDYGQKLVHLTADAHEMQLDTAAQSLGTNLDGLLGKYNSLVPSHAVQTGIGALFGELVSAGGDLYIRDRQAKGAKEFVARGDTLVGSMAATLEKFLSGDNSLQQLITNEQKNLTGNYRDYLQRDVEKIIISYEKDTLYKKDNYHKRDSVGKKQVLITGQVNAWRSSGIGADTLYLKLLDDLAADEQLRQQCLDAVQNLRKAHHKLYLDLQSKKNVMEVYSELQDYGKSISQMNATYKKIK